MELAISLNSFRSERRERNVTLKYCGHVWEHLHENRNGGSIYCTGFIEMEHRLTIFFLGYHRINTWTYLL